MKLQKFGTVTSYPKRNIYEFSNEMRFNDGGEGTMHGSVQWEMPLSVEHLNELHSRFGGPEAIQSQLVARVTNKSVYMTGPLLSSTESYAERRTDMIFWVEDQINNGTYRTRQVDAIETDVVTGEQRTVMRVELQLGEDGQPTRQERGQLTVFGITPFNFTVEGIDYGERVESQIQEQQQNIMRVQTAIAQAREAEQRALTAEQQGLADAAKARADQEVVKAAAVTEAEKNLQVAQLDRQTAEQERQANILRGQGEAERKRLVMAADGALDAKLAAWLEAQKAYASAIQGYSGAWVPSVVMGNGGEQPGGAALSLLEVLGARAAQELALDLRNRGGG